MNKLIVIIITILITGCATPIKQQYDELSVQKICCTGPSDFQYSEIVVGNEKEIKLNSKSPVYDFGTGNSYFSSFEVPKSDHYYYVKSFFNGMMIGQYYEPIFMALDENHKITETFSLKLEFIDATFSDDAHMAGVFKLKPKSKYLILFTSQLNSDAPKAQLGSSTYTYMAGSTPVIGQSGGYSKQLSRSPTGSIKIEAKPLKKLPDFSL